MKKLNYTLTVYKNTGFNGIDIPASGAVLELAEHTVYNDVYYLREDIDLPQISVNDNYHNLADVDYVKLVSNDLTPTVFYYFAVPHAAAGNTTVLNLELDALTTMGGAENLDYISGWQERGHISTQEDTLFSNIASEDWLPMAPLKNGDYVEIEDKNEYTDAHPDFDFQVIVSNIDLISIGMKSSDGGGNLLEAIKCGEINEQGQMEEVDAYVPEIKVNQSEDSTQFSIRVYEQSGGTPGQVSKHSIKIPNVCGFLVNYPYITEGLKLLFSCGQLQLQGSYTIPKEWILYKTIGGTTESYANLLGLIEKITGYAFNCGVTELPFEYEEDGYVPKNKKCYSMYRNYTLANISSGCTVTKPVYELLFGSNNAPIVTCWADPTTTGKPSAKFLSDISSHIGFADVVNGSQWINNQILMEGASGSLWNSINASFSQQNIDRSIAKADLDMQYAYKDIGFNENQMDINYERAKAQLALGSISSAGTLLGGIAMENPAGIASGVSGLANNALSRMYTNDMYNLNQAMVQNDRFRTADNYGYTLQALRQQANENRVGLIKNNSVVAPTTYFTPEPNLAMYGFNKFVVYETKLQKDDLISLDEYFQRYGYNGIHRPLNANCFTCRQYYCYVQAFDVNIKANKAYGLRVRQKAISQLNKGIRVWRNVLPDASYYELN